MCGSFGKLSQCRTPTELRARFLALSQIFGEDSPATRNRQKPVLGHSGLLWQELFK
jgi:hypothetical protein